MTIITHTKFDTDPEYEVVKEIESGSYGKCFKLIKDGVPYCLKVAKVSFTNLNKSIQNILECPEEIDDLADPYEPLKNMLPTSFSKTFIGLSEDWQNVVRSLRSVIDEGDDDKIASYVTQLSESLGDHLNRIKESYKNEFSFNANFLKETPYPNVYAYAIDFNLSDSDPKNFPYILMYYYPYCLAKYLEQIYEYKCDDFDDLQLLIIVYGIALAIAKIHESGHVHRDIKPDNILLDYQQRPHLADFGDFSSNQETEKLHGTSLYIAPESRQRGRNSLIPITKESDVFSFGGTLFHILTTEFPFYDWWDESNDSQYDQIFNIYFTDKDEWDSYVRGYLDDKIEEKGKISPFRQFLFDIVQKAWNACPEDRPTMESIVHDIEQYQREHLSQFKDKFEEYRSFACNSQLINNIEPNQESASYSSSASSASDDDDN